MSGTRSPIAALHLAGTCAALVAGMALGGTPCHAASLTFADAQRLAESPQCGRAEPGSEFARRLAAIAIYESAGGHPFAIGVNGSGGGSRLFNTAAEAIAYAHALDVQGRDFDAGLLQINRRQFARHGLTIETAFDPCRSMKAGADHYEGDVRAVFRAAHQRYNTGGTERGQAYADGVEAVLRRGQTQQAGLPAPSPMPQEPPAPPPCAPAWDAWALVQCSARQAIPPAPAPADGAPSGPTPVLTLTLGDTHADDR